MKTDHSAFEGANFFDGAKPITSHIMNNWQLLSVLVRISDKAASVNPFRKQIRRKQNYVVVFLFVKII